MGFIKALKKRRQKNASKKSAIKAALAEAKESQKRGPASPESSTSTAPATPEAGLLPKESDDVQDTLDKELHEGTESLQLSTNLQDSASIRSREVVSHQQAAAAEQWKNRNSMKMDSIIDAANIEAKLTEIKSMDEDDDSFAGSAGSNSNSQHETINELNTIRTSSSEKSLAYLWRYITCSLDPVSTFSLLHDDDESIFTIETEDGTVVTVPKQDLKELQNRMQDKENKDFNVSVSNAATPTKQNLTLAVLQEGAQEDSGGEDLAPRKLSF